MVAHGGFFPACREIGLQRGVGEGMWCVLGGGRSDDGTNGDVPQ